jgi:hypothetical protein
MLKSIARFVTKLFFGLLIILGAGLVVLGVLAPIIWEPPWEVFWDGFGGIFACTNIALGIALANASIYGLNHRYRAWMNRRILVLGPPMAFMPHRWAIYNNRNHPFRYRTSTALLTVQTIRRLPKLAVYPLRADNPLF